MICVMVYFRTRLNGRGQNRTLLELSEAHSAHDFVIKSESHSQLPERTGMVCTRPGFYAFQGRKLKKDKAISNRKGVGGGCHSDSLSDVSMILMATAPYAEAPAKQYTGPFWILRGSPPGVEARSSNTWGRVGHIQMLQGSPQVRADSYSLRHSHLLSGESQLPGSSGITEGQTVHTARERREASPQHVPLSLCNAEGGGAWEARRGPHEASWAASRASWARLRYWH